MKKRFSIPLITIAAFSGMAAVGGKWLEADRAACASGDMEICKEIVATHGPDYRDRYQDQLPQGLWEKAVAEYDKENGDKIAKAKAKAEKEQAERDAKAKAEAERKAYNELVKANRRRDEKAKKEANKERKELIAKAIGWGPGNDGSAHIECVAQLKNELRDPDSYQKIKYGPVVARHGEVLTYVKYRAKNGFGGYAVGTKTCAWTA